MLHCPTRKTHQSSPPADGSSRLPWNGSSTATMKRENAGSAGKKRLTMPQTYHLDSRCIVWFHHCVRHLWRRNHGEGFHNASVVRSSWKMSAMHVWKLNLVKGTERNWENSCKTYCKWDAVWIFLTHFGDQQCAHSSASAATERMAKLEALQTSLVELLNQKERPLSLHLNRTQYWRRKESLKQLFGKVAATTILFKTSISRIPLLLFGQHQVPSQLTQHLRCSDPDRFFKSNSWKIIQNCNHEHHLAFAQLLPAPARQFKQQNPIIWQFNLATSDIWKDYDGSGNELDGQTDCKIRGAKKFPIKTLCRTTSRHQPVCPKTKLSGRNNWPNGPARTLSMVPARESNLIPASTVLKAKCVDLLHWNLCLGRINKLLCCSASCCIRDMICGTYFEQQLCNFSNPSPGSRSIRTARGT